MESQGRSSHLLHLGASLIGYASLASLVYSAGYFFYDYFLRPSRLRIYRHAEEDSWALVTGASDGIGRAFADELLAQGFNVLLHGRNPEKLARIKRELNGRFPARSVEFVVADATRGDHPEDAVVAKVKSLSGKLTVLINNVGGIVTKPTYTLLADISADAIDDTININARFPTQLNRALLPTMRKNSPALIINCGSGAGLSGFPYIATYSATKAYVHALSTALRNETFAQGGFDIEVFGVIIGNVMSASNKSHVPVFTISSEQCARGVLGRVGCGAVLTFAHWRHAVQTAIFGLLPQFTREKLMIKEMEGRVAAEAKGE